MEPAAARGTDGQVSRPLPGHSGGPGRDEEKPEPPGAGLGGFSGEVGFDGLADLEAATKLFAQQSEPRERVATTGLVNFPVSTADFEDRFFTELAALRVTGRQLALAVIAEWATEQGDRLAEVRRYVERADVRRLLAQRLAALDHRDRGVARLGLLTGIVDLRWVGQLFARILTDVEEQTAVSGANAYPLAANQALAWYQYLSRRRRTPVGR